MSSENESGEIREFIHNLLHNQKTHGLLLCGSTFEMPIQYVWTNMNDMDIMYFPLDICALPADSPQTPIGFQGKILTIRGDISHPGFARLHDANQSLITHGNGGPASTTVLRGERINEDVSTILFKTKGKHEGFKVDRVYAVRCPCWPAEAVEWISRERKYGWPSKDVVDGIVKRGCHFVAKSPRSNSSDCSLWRISFSLAETILVHNWTDVQKYVYHLLKLIKNEVAKDVREDCKTVLCSYFLKTLMFWACEEMGPEFWNDENLENSVAYIICLMIECLVEKRCRNYFISNSNLLCGLKDSLNVNRVLELLAKHCENRTILQIMSIHKKAYPKLEFKIAIPNKLLLLVHSLQARECYYDPFVQGIKKYILDSLTRKDSLFWSQWISLHKAIKIQLRLASSLTCSETVADVTNDIKLALDYFMHSFTSVDDTNSETTVSLGESFFENSARFWVEMKPDSKSRKKHKFEKEVNIDRRHELINISLLSFGSSVKCDHRVCCYRRKFEERRITIERQDYSKTSQFPPVIIQTAINKTEETIVKPSFIASAAYLANFCYTTLSVFNRRMATAVFEYTCMRLLDCNPNAVACERLFPIAITNKLSPLFDKHFQTVIGFLTLCRSISESSESSSVIVRICPAQLLKYLGVQFGQYKHFKNDTGQHDFHCNHSFYLSFDHHELLSEKFMSVVLRLNQFSKSRDRIIIA